MLNFPQLIMSPPHPQQILYLRPGRNIRRGLGPAEGGSTVGPLSPTYRYIISPVYWTGDRDKEIRKIEMKVQQGTPEVSRVADPDQ